LLTPPRRWREEIRRITGTEVREATAEVEATTGTVVQVVTTGAVVQVFLLARGVAESSWSGLAATAEPDGGSSSLRPCRAARLPSRPLPGESGTLLNGNQTLVMNMKTEVYHAVLSRKSQESVVVGGTVGFERLLKVTVSRSRARR